MKKTFTLSISGRIFQVEEDAYALLLDYLESLSQVFKGADGGEIVADIETRIGEIFQEEADKGKIVFTLADAEAVVATIGDAGQLAADDTVDDTAGDTAGHADGTGTHPRSETAGGACPPPVPEPPAPAVKRKLFRSDTDRVLGGVLGGLAVRFGLGVLPLRIITVLLLFVLDVFPILVAYCVAWAIIPLADTPERKLEQQGRPVTVANIGAVLSSRDSKPHGPGTTLLRVFCTLCMGFMGLVAGCVAIGVLVSIVVLLFILAAFMIGVSIPDNILAGTHWDTLSVCCGAAGMISAICVCIAILVPCIATVWAACCVLFKTKGASKTVWITALIVEAVAILVPSITIPLLCIR